MQLKENNKLWDGAVTLLCDSITPLLYVTDYFPITASCFISYLSLTVLS